MRYYLIDEINSADLEKLSLFLGDKGIRSSLEKIYWITVPDEYLTETQSSHGDCRPYVFAVELSTGMIKAEFFIRTKKDIKCSCSGYPDSRQIQFIIRFVDEMIRELEIRT